MPDLMVRRDVEGERAVREYVEWQAPDEAVAHAERVTTEFVLGRRLDAWDVRTDRGRWWVITSPTNLYSQDRFPSLDYAISFHVGVTTRMMSEPDTGAHPAEKALLAGAWRRWEQAAEALAEAEEADDYQEVGGRCRGCFVAMAKEAASPEMVPAGQAAPKRGDAKGWSALIADHVAGGDSAQHVRAYLKAIAREGWDLVAWLSHAAEATEADAVLAVEATQHVLASFGMALLRKRRGVPPRCVRCGSSKLSLWLVDDDGAEAVPRCRACGAVHEPANDEGLAPSG